MIKSNASKITADNYHSLKKFLNCFFEWYFPDYFLSSSVTPVEFLEDIEKTSLSNARRGLQMAINDIVEIVSREWNVAQILEADKRLAAAGMITLSELQLRYTQKCAKIFKSGIINNEVEYYVVKNAIDDGSVELGTPEGGKLQAMLSAYDDRILKKLNLNRTE